MTISRLWSGRRLALARTNGSVRAGNGLFLLVANPYAFSTVVAQVAFLVPFGVFYKIARSGNGPMPAISMLVVVANGVWWYFLPTINAFVWATIFHGIQYLAIVIIFHVKDQMARPNNRHGRTYHVISFYVVSLLLGYGLFQCLPGAYQFFGFGVMESSLLVVAAINVHHFIVDAYVWRLGNNDTNRRIVEGRVPSPV